MLVTIKIERVILSVEQTTLVYGKLILMYNTNNRVIANRELVILKYSRTKSYERWEKYCLNSAPVTQALWL